ncbi:DNA-binding protein, partial [Enterococcus asini]|uniref:DNA-binding protein n=1 Tax=Enterococcus asini TaxID=57732 RepID=UPI00288DE6BA
MAVEITLSPDQETSLREYMYTLMVDEVRNARIAVHLENRYLSKKETCEYLGIANNTLDKWIGFESIPRTRFARIFSRFQRVSISSF